ncbi:MAG: response regulator transcription factor [Bacillaceae bacterium]|uniref:Response regulator transcription factor n=1 Tax=Alkalihalobacterium chitinilyticum TaxID=2980103 RepID=A0ABT5VHF0_9BACI|nr:response regulator transcription factor [Alkalihalobacterium chitinilyticum]MDE5414616.1 response regulator transcription factor [Alkalihalobacterium chitinilyticum]MEB1806911.1 response regulator transcription factor [Bacillaceae bacterium]
MTIRILIADDHHVVRRGLRFFLDMQSDIEIIGEATDGQDAINKVNELHPDVVLMDLVMPTMDGIEATKKIRETHRTIKILILTSFSDQDHVIPAIRAGANGYQLKDIEPDELVKTIKAVYNGQSQLHPEVTHHVLTHMSGGKEEQLIDTLTKREKEVLLEITNGKSNKEIAATLFITEKTVKTHVSNLLSKLELSDRTQAALYAIKHGLK